MHEGHAGLAFETLELELGVFKGLLGRGNAVLGPGFELVAFLLEELVVELQRAAVGILGPDRTARPRRRRSP